MRRLTVGVAVAAVAMSIAACGGSKGSGPAASTTGTTTTTTTSSSKPPIAQAALANLLLTPAEVDGLLGVTGTASKDKIDKLQDDTTGTPGPPGWKFPDECLYAKGPVVAPVYAGSGNTAVSGDMDTTNLNNDQDIMMGQAVVLFPSAKEANDFFRNVRPALACLCGPSNRRAHHPGRHADDISRSAPSPMPTEF